METVNLPETSGLYRCLLFETKPDDLYLRIGDKELHHWAIAMDFAREANLMDSEWEPGRGEKVRGGAYVQINLEKRTMLFIGSSGDYGGIDQDKVMKTLNETGFLIEFYECSFV
ncbi:hypothetical protein HY498_05670 [Candidatus Woesearchaeota archaeon]|nr:hypothetical protein [Candidatus Woesearchaeota archaeon]